MTADEPGKTAEARNTMRRLRHAARTPIGQIVGYSELLLEDVAASGREDWARDLERIRKAGLDLLALLDQILGGEPEAAVAAPDPPAPDPAAAAARERTATLGARLLVVDDDTANRDLLARRLAALGYEVTAVDDGASALRRIEAEPFDLVLLDVLMPNISGLEVLGAIRREHPPTVLPVILATALDSSGHVVEGLRLGANDYVTKPLDLPVVQARIEAQLGLKRAHEEIARLARHLEIRNAFIRRVFGRYVSDEIVDTLLEEPQALELRGESREVTVLVADLRGFSSLTAECTPTEVLTLLNHYLGAMAETIQEHGGTIDDFFGDGLLAFFGAPVAQPDHAVQAVRCAVVMQLALHRVNRTLRDRGLPLLEMGVGIDTGEVIVGSMGSERRSKYGAIGLPLNLASRIESCTLGGEILITDNVLAAVGDVAEVDQARLLHPKSFEEPLRVHRVVGVRGEASLRIPDVEQSLIRLPEALPVELALLEGKQVGGRVLRGRVRQLSVAAARIECEEALAEMTDVRLVFPEGAGFAGACYAKVVSAREGDPPMLTARFTTRPSELIEAMRRFLADLG
jgi:adenylate cyclase